MLWFLKFWIMQLLLERSVKMEAEAIEEKQQQQKPQEVSSIQIDSLQL